MFSTANIGSPAVIFFLLLVHLPFLLQCICLDLFRFAFDLFALDFYICLLLLLLMFFLFDLLLICIPFSDNFLYIHVLLLLNLILLLLHISLTDGGYPSFFTCISINANIDFSLSFKSACLLFLLNFITPFFSFLLLYHI